MDNLPGIVNGINSASAIGFVARCVVASWTVGARSLALEGVGRGSHGSSVVPSPLVVTNPAISGYLDDEKDGHATKDPKTAPLCMQVSSCAPVRVGLPDIPGSPILTKTPS